MEEFSNRITVDGYCNQNGKEGYEWIHRGGQPDPEALVSINYSTFHTPEVLELLEYMKNGIKEMYEGEQEAKTRKNYGERLNRKMIAAGHKPFSQKKLDIICDANMLL